MPLSPDEAGALTPGERFIMALFTSSTDVQLSDGYDGSGSFDARIPIPQNGVTPKIIATFIKQYVDRGWRGSWSELTEDGYLIVHLRVKSVQVSQR